MYDIARTARPPSPVSPLPPDYVSALKLTPRGLATLERLKAFERPGFQTSLKVSLVDTAIAGGDHAQTTGSAAGISTTISRYNQNDKDRMYLWSADEMVNIVGIHESEHIRLLANSAETDECFCFFCDCHERVIFQELIARFQFSLLLPDAATGKQGWLARYSKYFAAARKMRADKAYRKLCDKMAATSDRRAFAGLAEEAAEYEVEHPPQPPFDTSAGEALAVEAYKAALDDMEARAAQFAAEGSFTDAGPYKKVLDNIADYRSDSGFARIP